MYHFFLINLGIQFQRINGRGYIEVKERLKNAVPSLWCSWRCSLSKRPSKNLQPPKNFAPSPSGNSLIRSWCRYKKNFEKMCSVMIAHFRNHSFIQLSYVLCLLCGKSKHQAMITYQLINT